MLESGFERDAVDRVAKSYKRQGYVVVYPERDDLPFDLGGYVPDLVVYGPSEKKYMIDVKVSGKQIPVERYREIASIVSVHPGWRFLLVTTDSPLPNLEGTSENNPLTWPEIIRRVERARHMISLGEAEAAFLILWAVLEALMRNRAESVQLPLGRTPPLTLMSHLYSQGELPFEQFEETKALLPVRNTLVHGFQTPNVHDASVRLLNMINELIDLWQPAQE